MLYTTDMSTRATIRFAKREEGVSFNEHPHQWHAQFYRHHDGYPEGLGVEIAESFTKYGKLLNWEVESLDIVHGDIEYMYYIWQCHGKTEPWISIFKDEGFSKCIFVGTPDMLLDKFNERHTEIQEASDCVTYDNDAEVLIEKFLDIDSCCGDDRDPDLCGSGCCKNTN